MTVKCLFCNTEQKMFYGMWYCPKCKSLPNHYVFMVELAQKEVFDEAMEIYAKLKNFEHDTKVKKAYEHDIQALITHSFLGFERKFRSLSPKKVVKG